MLKINPIFNDLMTEEYLTFGGTKSVIVWILELGYDALEPSTGMSSKPISVVSCQEAARKKVGESPAFTSQCREHSGS